MSVREPLIDDEKNDKDENIIGVDGSDVDVDDIDSVVNTYSHTILRYCHSILCDYHESQDALQITFIKFWQNKSKFTGDSKDLLNFLYKIAYNNCIDAIRKRKHKQKYPAAHSQSNINNYNYSHNDYIPDNIKSALLSLSVLDRAIIYSHAVDAISFAELAKIYGKTAAGLRKRYERARKKLGVILSGDYPGYKNIIKKGENDNE